MRTPLAELEVAAVASRLPADGETVGVEITPRGPCDRGSRVDLPAFADDPRRDPGLPSSLRRRIDRFSALAYLAVAEVLAELPDGERPARERIGTFLCNTRAGWAYGEPELGLLVDRGPEAMHAYQATAWFPAAAQGEVTIALDLRGCAKTTVGRETGFAEAVWLAWNALERDAIDLAIVGVAESLVSEFVLRDWDAAGPLPVHGPAEGAVVFALRRPGSGGSARIGGLGDPVAAEPAVTDWVPTLGAASRLRDAVLAPRTAGPTTVAIGGGHRVEIQHTDEHDTAPTTQPHRDGDPMSTVLSTITPTGHVAAEARHELTIPGPADSVFEMTRDVLRWSEYMPAVTEAAFVEQGHEGDLVQITAEANDQRHTWRSRRAVDRAARTIEFTRVEPSAPLVAMRGRWEFVDEGQQTRAVLTHSFATTTPEALEFFTNATRSNATRDLEGLADYFTRTEAVR